MWSPDNAPLSVQRGGHNLNAETYAIGSNNNIAVRVANAENPIEQITRISQILLYEHSGSRLTKVSSMVVGRAYVVVADIDTNVDSEQRNAVVATQMMAEYEIDQSMENVAELEEMIRNEGDIKNSKQDLEFIRLTVNNNITEKRLVTVGWNSIAGIPDGVTADYLVFPQQPAGYAEEDTDGDNVPNMIGSSEIDSYPTSSTRLQVTINGNTGGVHYVQSHNGSVNGDQLQQLPMFLTHTGLAIADENPNADHYSAANIKYDQIAAATKTLLGIVDSESASAIYSIATFGVSDMEYGFTYDDAGMVTGISGGAIYVTFPIDVSFLVGDETTTLYIGKYNSEDKIWQSFERMGTEYADTWYAIEREHTSIACPQDIEVYRSGHRGTDHGGFMASMDNCIMLVITDGHPLHDESGRDGRVIDPMSISTERFLLPPPSGLSVVARNGDIVLNWQPVVGATSYRIYRNSSANRPAGRHIATTSENSYTDRGLSPRGILLQSDSGQRTRRGE